MTRRYFTAANAAFRLSGLNCISVIALGLTPFAMTSRSLAQSAEPIYQSETYSVWPDHVIDGAYSARALSSSEIVSSYPTHSHQAAAESRWKLDEDISTYPQVQSSYPLLDALYNLSLSELKKDQRPDGAFNAGATWGGVWTRDVSYSTLLSLAAVAPEGAKASLLQKVKRDRIVQDTGTGGSWPVSTDRVTWALAAWQIYLVTGDRQWLQQSYNIISNSIKDDEHVVIDGKTGLAHGESSFLDWREQTFPRWMQPADIYSSNNLGTNAVYYRTYRILASMAHALNLPSEDWTKKADRMREAINKNFWLEDKGYFGQYLYGRVWPSLSPRAEALGESLSILFDIPDGARQDRILRSQPLMPYGIPTVYPATPGIPPYHNRAVWPFVQAFWNLAAAKRGNETALLYGLASIYRDSALFLSNKENFVADTGSPIGTEINSDRQLWSVTGNLAMVYRVLFGMNFEEDGLRLNPVVPESLKGTRRLTNFHYRQSILSLEVRGFGSHVRSVLMDGKPAPALIPADLQGSHSIILELDDQPFATAKLNLVKNAFAPDTPFVKVEGRNFTWDAIDGASEYRLQIDGKPGPVISTTSYTAPDNKRTEQYQVMALDASGVGSFLSEPVTFPENSVVISIPDKKDGNPASFVALASTGVTGLSVNASVAKKGLYILSFLYANGSGGVKFENKCANRALFIDGDEIGPIVFPQRGQDEWNNWGQSNIRVVELSAGAHQFELRLMPYDTNMNVEINSAHVASMSLIPLQRHATKK
jgi:hypothetical protein